jgi:ABC-type dipeptide/oligopeptide/nickel transport system permease subunit
VQATISFPVATAEAALYLGLGATAASSWGLMLREAQAFLVMAPICHLPGTAIA